MISIVILIVVFVLIAVRQIGRVRFQIWQIMLFGAIGVLVSGQISLAQAARSINLDVILFLFGVFVVGEALEQSGYLSELSNRLFRRARSFDSLLLAILFGAGIMSTFLMNDTLAIIGTPVVLLMARRNNLPVKPLLLTLAFAVTIGSVMSPIGNPQNLLIALEGEMANPFVTFAGYLFLPTMVNLLAAYLLLRLFFRKHLHLRVCPDGGELITDPKLARLTKGSLIILLALIAARVAMVFLGVSFDFRLTYIALAAAAPVILGSPKRAAVLKSIDWHTLVFFAAMFVLTASAWNSGFFQSILDNGYYSLTSVVPILGISTALSQLISNVPMVALYLPTLMQLGGGTGEMMALAAGSTIAGNLSILGAASNVIIIQNAEKRAKVMLTFPEFIRVGLPLTAVNILIYWAFLH
ncbi:MAG: anion transporter [Dehalococcoidales bacterium]|nr:anion transporter [Dehalococcoidales bacterium]